MIQALDHFTLIVSDLQATQNFYVESLGLTLLQRPDFDFRGLWFGNEGLQIHVIEESQLTGKSGMDLRVGGRPSRHLHFAFQVADFDEAVQKVCSSEIRVLDGPKKRPDGIRQLFIADPDGYVVELCEAPRMV